MEEKSEIFDRLAAPVGSRYGTLLLLLVFMVVIYSFIGQHKVMRWTLDFASVVLVVLALRAIAMNRTTVIVAAVLGILSAIAGSAAGSFAIESAFPFGTGIRTVFFGFLVVEVFRDIARRQAITMDAVFGVCCVYLLLGLAWGALYALAEWIDPTSFALVDHAPVAGQAVARANETELVYFSMITMTGVGYGDIVPHAPPARTLAALEALMGQLYLAIVIARIVALEVASRGRDPG